jgi:hypothetical protein
MIYYYCDIPYGRDIQWNEGTALFNGETPEMEVEHTITYKLALVDIPFKLDD